VVMLRPTESNVVFLQQLGRGLRASDGKASVTVIDFVGNDRMFLERMRALLSLGGSEIPQLRPLLEQDAPLDLPSGCIVELEIEAKSTLAHLLQGGGADEIERVYRELYAQRRERPSAGELERLGYSPGLLRKNQQHASWFDFVHSEGHLSPEETPGFRNHADLMREIETTPMTKCFKMVTLEALIEAHALRDGLPLRDLGLRAHAILRRSPDLFGDVIEAERRSELDSRSEKAWLAYWRKNPIDAWTKGRAARGSGSLTIGWCPPSPSVRMRKR